jgi:leucyl-tRNA synthetase
MDIAVQLDFDLVLARLLDGVDEEHTALVELMELVRLMERRDALNTECYEALLKLLLPFVPHLAEELWERSGHATLLSLESWPQADESRIDLRAEEAAEVEGSLVQDVRRVLELSKIEKPQAITVILAPAWKYVFVERFKALSQETREPGLLLKSLLADPVLKQHGQDIAKMVPAIVKDPSKLPQTMLSADEELAAVVEATRVLETAFGCPFRVEHAESSTDPKAKAAFPGRPGISVR